MDKKNLGKLAEYFGKDDNILIKKQLLSAIHKETTGSDAMSEVNLDKTIKMVSYTIQLYKLSDEMGKKINQICE